MTQFTQTSTLEINKKKIPCPRKGEFNFYTVKNGVLKVKNSKCQEKDVVLDRDLEGFNTVNTLGITEETTVLEAIELLTTNSSTGVSDLTIPTTYQNLIDLRNASELVVGQKYLITDFAQSYNIFDGSNNGNY